jgi:hypothetical protein
MSTEYFINPTTRGCMIISGRGSDHVADDGFMSVSEGEMQLFRANTQKLVRAGWNKRPATLGRYLHLLSGGAA